MAESKTVGKAPRLYVQGPNSCSVWQSSTYRKTIVVFGEAHEGKVACATTTAGTMRIDQFLQYLFREELPTTKLDCFVEAPFLKGKEQRGGIVPRTDTVNLVHVWAAFAECLQVSKTKCPYKNVRMHYVDVRRLTTSPSIRALMKWIEERSISDEDLEMLCDSGAMEVLLRDIKFDIQLASIRYVEVRRALFTYWIKHVKEALENICQELENLTLATLLLKLLAVSVRIMDAYLLARIFRCFADGEEPENVVVIVGNDHAANVERFLHEELKTFEQPVPRVVSPHKCLDLSNHDWRMIFAPFPAAAAARKPCPKIKRK